MTHGLVQCSLAASLILLTACGGGGGGAGGGGGNDGGGETPQNTPFTDQGGTERLAVTAISLTSETGSSTEERKTGVLFGEFNQETGTFSLGDFAGDVNTAGDTVTNSDGDRIDIIAGPTEHAAFFVATAPDINDGDRTIGIVGFRTTDDDLPRGSATYTGTSEVTVLDQQSVFALTGDATIIADFSGGLVDTTVDNLSGTVTTGANAPTAISDVATITFTGSGLESVQFMGGAAGITSSTLTDLSGSEATSLNGAFYGPGADEAGATFVIDDATNDGVTVFGTVLAD